MSRIATKANRTARIVEKHLRQAQVDRAKDLPEEARVRLFRDLRVFYEDQAGSGDGALRHSREGLWTRMMRRLEDFLSFSDMEPNVYLPYAYCATMPFCDGMRQMSVPMMKKVASTTHRRQSRRRGS
jgi:hypothetical protein